jgi:hypothetical protein
MCNIDKCYACNSIARLAHSGLCIDCEAELDAYIAGNPSPVDNFDTDWSHAAAALGHYPDYEYGEDV